MNHILVWIILMEKKGRNWKAIHVVEIVCYNSGSHLSLNCGENI